MRTYLFFVIILIYVPAAAQQFPYGKKWEEIEKQEKQGLLKSTLPAVNEIYAAAKREGNVRQRIRALLYRGKIAIITADDDEVQLKVVQDFGKEIASTKGVEKNILQSMLAETLYSYYQNNRWKINERTRLEEATTEDFRFWSENIFDDRVTALYYGSLENPEGLQQPVEKWDDILEAGQPWNANGKQDKTVKDRLVSGRELRPYVYDLLAHRAIDFFRDQPGVFFTRFSGSAEMKAKRDKALELLRNLADFHRKKGNTNAWLYNELEILKTRKDEYEAAMYIAELEKLSGISPGAWYTGEVLLELARFFREQEGKEEANEYGTRKEWCDKALSLTGEIEKTYPGTHAAGQAAGLGQQIRAAGFSIRMESYVPSGQEAPISVTHKNLDLLHFKVLKFRPDLDDFFRNPENEIRYARDGDKQKVLNALLRQYPEETTFRLSLKAFDDYQDHTTTASLGALPAGSYIVLAANDPDFNVNSKGFVLQALRVDVTDHAIVSNRKELLVTQRQTGLPETGRTIEVYRRNNKGLNLVRTLTTNASGRADTSFRGRQHYQLYYRVKGEDVFYSEYGYYHNPDYKKETDYDTRFFTDRSIYRPGQTVYFKAIHYEEAPDGSRKVLENKTLDVELLDPNDNTVGELQLITNRFGSVSGEFVLPAGGITGTYTLEDSYGEAYTFSVEEYKRPRFEVTFDTVKGTPRLEKEITARGRAQAYSGGNIDKARVTYRVYRQAVYPYLPWWRRSYITSEPREEIAHGETITGTGGDFDITFEAKAPSRPVSEKKKKEPRTYTYTVEADVTDLNGETRSGRQDITVGDLRYTLGLDMPAQVEWDALETITVNTRNLNGEFVPARGRVILAKIVPPDRVLRKSPLPGGDYELYDKAAYVEKFPNDPYANEDKKEHWKKESPVVSVDFDTGKEKEIRIKPGKNWKEGYYLLEGYILDEHDTIPAEQLVYLYKKEKKQPVDHEFFSVTSDKDSYKPGETARVVFASSALDVTVFAALEFDGRIVKREHIKLDNSVKDFSFPVKKEYRGNVFVHYYFGKYNTARQGTVTIVVPAEENQLEITAGTMRDRLQPGDEENWELTVSGKGADAFLAGLATGGTEVLAAMYDASLDQFKPHNINWTPYQKLVREPGYDRWNINMGYGTKIFSRVFQRPFPVPDGKASPLFDRINWFGFDINGRGRQNILIRGAVRAAAPAQEVSSFEMEEVMNDDDRLEEVVVTGYAPGLAVSGTKKESEGDGAVPDLSSVQARKALQETAFFFPHLKTDEKGRVKIRFTTPESLTEWKFMALAHTPELQTANYQASIRTQKELMVVPNPPRFLREGDTIVFRAKVTNLSGKTLSGNAQLLLFDAFTMQPVDTTFGNDDNNREFTSSQGESTNVSWELKVPSGQQAVVYRVVARAGNTSAPLSTAYSDGEESALPVLTNRMLVTETLPVHIREGQEKTFQLEKLTRAGQGSATLENFKLTFEMTTNPVWYAIFSLPYLREFPYECSEQVFSRLYGNLISQYLVNSNPKIKTFFDDWNSKGQLKSKLELNEELKSLLLEETPWVRQAADEEEQMKRIAVLFDLNKMRNELEGTFRKLEGKQLPSGGFPWFDGGHENVYITTHIISGFGHLRAMGVDSDRKFDSAPMLQKAIRYIDSEMEEQWDRYKKNDKYPPSTYSGVYWMYARSYFLKEYPLSRKGREMADYFLKEFEKEKTGRSRYHQAMLSLVFHRFGKSGPAKALLLSAKDQAVESDEMGMYWKDNLPGWYWYNAPVETQALLIEAFDEVLDDTESVELMKVWLLKNRQTNRWISTKATTEAVFALMSTGKDWVNAEGGLEVSLGGEPLDMEQLEGQQKGTGYVKTSWDKDEITPEMGTVEVKKTSPGVAWGALYWQYFENLDKITAAETGIRFKKQLFLKKLTDKGPELQRITENTPIKTGDLVTIRLEIRNDRDMEFVHIKDMRASGFEPVNVLSGYKWQGGLGYYESTRDAATNFFADRMPKGVYVFEYDLRANNAGNFSNGITTLQCMYAPEMSAHSEGIRVGIK